MQRQRLMLLSALAAGMFLVAGSTVLPTDAAVAGGKTITLKLLLPQGDTKVTVDGKEIPGSGEERKITVTTAKDKDYDQAVHSSVWPYIERYLADYRAVLGGSRPEFVFVSSVNPNIEWEGLDRRYFILTQRYVPGCPGVGPHAIRHIVATSIIIKTGDFLLAADTLHDKPATVEKHYSHLLASVGDRGRRQALGDTYDKVSERHRRGASEKSAA